MPKYSAITTKKNNEISYREFELAANRDSKDSYPPVKFGGFEWPESWYSFESLVVMSSNLTRKDYWIDLP
jgi:hypothetical protein